MPNPIASIADLRAAVAALPPVASGFLRVWRGQGQDHAQMLPSGLRRSIRNRAIWQVYCQHLHLDMVPGAFGADGQASVQTLQVAGLWLQAVAQHYGPGSDFLDVTHSIEVALWFALNHYREIRTESLIGPAGPPDPLRDHPTLGMTATYDAWAEPAYLYAFDLPPWNSEGLPEGGMVVDLARAPAVFADSPRMRAQVGCLVYCRRPDGSALDLRAHCVSGTPLRVQRPMSGAQDIDRSVAQMFPSPAADRWYARLLSVPLNYAPEPIPPRLQRSIPVVPYFDVRDPDYSNAVVWREVALSMPLLHRALPAFVEPPDPARRPVAIVLEAPMVFPYPRGESGEWHHGLLAEDQPAQCDFYDPGCDTPGGRVELDRVLFEFSALEHTGWERVIDGQHTIESALRGVWLQRVAGHWVVNYLRQTLPGGALEPPQAFAMRFDAERRRWVFFAPGDDTVVLPLPDAPDLAKPALVALMLLRHLNPALKFNPLPRLSVGRGDGGRRMLVTATRDAARLVRARSPVCDWFVLRDSHAPEVPFSHDTHPEGHIELRVEGEYADVPLAMLRGPSAPTVT